MRMTKLIFAISLHLAAVTFGAAEIRAQQVPDPDFKPPIEKPAYAEGFRPPAQRRHAARSDQRLASGRSNERRQGARRDLRRSRDVFGATGRPAETPDGNERPRRQTEPSVPAQCHALAFRPIRELAGARAIYRGARDLNQNNKDWYNQPPQDAKVRKGKTCPDRSLRPCGAPLRWSSLYRCCVV